MSTITTCDLCGQRLADDDRVDVRVDDFGWLRRTGLLGDRGDPRENLSLRLDLHLDCYREHIMGHLPRQVE